MERNKITDAQRPGGFLDYLPEDYIAREKMIGSIARVFASYGFDPIETPAVEFMRTLCGEESETGKQIFTIGSRDVQGEELALRFDHTVPLARLLAQNPYDQSAQSGIRLPWRRMVYGPVFRGERPQQGRYRQFSQFDADIAGTDEMIADAEIIMMMHRTMIALGVERFQIKINNRKILNGLAQIAALEPRGKWSTDDLTKEMMRILDKIDKVGSDAVLEQLMRSPVDEDDRAPHMSSDSAEKIRCFLSITGSTEDIIRQCRTLFSGSAVAQSGLDEIEEVMRLVTLHDVGVQRCVIDLSIARGLDYYTGTVMETVLTDAQQFGSVFSGGRYDGLVRRFTGQDLPAVGASIGVDRLVAALSHLGVLDMTQKTYTDVMILRIISDGDAHYMRIAEDIRSMGMNVDVALLRDHTFNNQFSYALSRGVRYVVICGERELERDVVQVKDLMTRQQEEVTMADVRSYFSQKNDARII